LLLGFPAGVAREPRFERVRDDDPQYDLTRLSLGLGGVKERVRDANE
jgi:hypothetical protein